jgi:hypothetical protein
VVTGGGFPPSTPLIISYAEPRADATPPVLLLASIVSNSDGSIPPTTVTIPVLASQGSVGLVTIGPAPGEAAPATQPIGKFSTPFAVTPLFETLTTSSSVMYPGGSLEISGAGFPPHAPIALRGLDAAGSTLVSTGLLTTTATGWLPPVQMSVPNSAAPGAAVIDAYDATGMAAGLPITILPSSQAGAGSLRVQPVRVSIGSIVQVTATGLQPGEPVALSLVGASGASTSVPGITDLIADASGVLQGSFAVPAAANLTEILGPGGGNVGTLLSVSVRGAQSGVTSSAPLLVSATRLVTDPAGTLPGQAVTILGFGFAAQEEVTVTLADPSGGISQIGRVAAGGDGSFSLTTVAPAGGVTASGPPVTFLLTATGETSGLVATCGLGVHNAPALSLQPYVVQPGQTVQLLGTGFTPNATTAITASFTLSAPGGPRIQHFLAATDKNGAFAATFAVPSTAQMVPVPVQAADAQGNSATIMLTINTQSPMLRVTPFAAHAGQKLSVQGTGFASGERVDIYLAVPASHPVALPGTTLTIQADLRGKFTVAFVLPGNVNGASSFPSGSYLLVASGEASARAAINAFVLSAQTGTPQPTATPTPTGSNPVPGSPTPVACVPAHGNPLTTSAQGVIYLAGASTVQLASGGSAIDSLTDLQVFNDGDSAVTITVAYLISAASGSGSPTVRTVTFLISPHSIQVRSVNQDAGSGHQVGVIVRVDSVAGPTCQPAAQPCSPGVCAAVRASLLIYRLRRTDPASGRQAEDVLDASSMSGTTNNAGANEPQPSTSWFFAEGYSGAGFQEYLNLFNPQNAPAHVHLYLVTATGLVGRGITAVLRPLAQKSIDVRAAYEVLLTCRPATKGAACGKAPPPTGLAMIVHSDMPVVASRALYWGSGVGSDKAGFDVATGSIVAARQLAFAYASTLDRDTAFLSVLNPASCHGVAGTKTCPTAQVVVRVFTTSGAQIASTRLNVGADSRGNLALNSLVDRGIYAVLLQATEPIVAEIAQYVGGSPSSTPAPPGLDLQGTPGSTSLHDSGLVSGAAATWQPLVHVYNPSAGHTVVRLSAMSAAGAYFTRTYQIASQATLEVRIPVPPASSSPSPGSQASIGLSLSCSSPCVGAALEGVRGVVGSGESGLPREAWGESLH